MREGSTFVAGYSRRFILEPQQHADSELAPHLPADLRFCESYVRGIRPQVAPNRVLGANLGVTCATECSRSASAGGVGSDPLKSQPRACSQPSPPSTDDGSGTVLARQHGGAPPRPSLTCHSEAGRAGPPILPNSPVTCAARPETTGLDHGPVTGLAQSPRRTYTSSA